MSRPASQILRTPIFFALLALTAMLALSFSLRKNDFTEISGSQNLEASYHVLLTVKAMDESPARNHLFLPSVTLGNEADKHIQWGGTVPTKTGDYIYTSFNFPGFVAPFMWFKALNIEQNITNLSYFNVLLGAISSLILLALCYNLLRFAGYNSYVASAAAISACAISIFSREALLSHGLTYWAQSLYQIILGATLLSLHKFLSSAHRTNLSFYSLATLAFVGALTEWSGYILNTGLVLLLWLGCQDSKDCRKLAVGIFVATALAGICTVIHFSAAVGFDPALEAILGRFLARSTSAGSLTGLIQGYGQSYGLFLLLVIGIAAVSGFTKKPEAEMKNSQILLIVFLASCFPLIENLVMLQHAMEYTFDRLKFIFPAAILFALCFARSKFIGRSLLIISLVAASFQGYKTYRGDITKYFGWGAIDKNNVLLAEKVKSTASKCAVFASSIGVRGYATLLFNHGIYESMTLQDAEKLVQRRSGCELVYIEGSLALTDLPKYSKATIRKEDGSVEVISSELQLSVIDGR